MVNPRVAAGFDDVIARGMAKAPDDRYGTAGGLGRAAHRALAAGGPNFFDEAVPPTGGSTVPPPAGGAAPRYVGPTAVPVSGAVPVDPSAVPADRDSRLGGGWGVLLTGTASA